MSEQLHVKDGRGIMIGSSGKPKSIFICSSDAKTWIAELPEGKESEAWVAKIVSRFNAHSALVEALKQIEAHHYAMKGEASDDPNRYCVMCITQHTGRSRVYPCRTVKLARVALATALSAALAESTEQKGTS